MNLSRNFAPPALRLHHAGQRNELAACSTNWFRNQELIPKQRSLGLLPPLFDNFQGISLVRPYSSSTQHRAHGTDCAPLPADDLAHIALRDLEFNHVAVELLHKNLLGRIHQ